MNLFERTKARTAQGLKALGIFFTGTTGRETTVRQGVTDAFGLAGTRINWSAITGRLQENAAAYSCYRTIALNYMQAPPRLQQRDGDTWEVVDADPVTQLLRAPYPPFMDGAALAWAYLGSLLETGNAYIGIEVNEAGLPARLKWLPPDSVTAERNPDSLNLLDYYRYAPAGKNVQRIEIEDIIHLRFGVNPNDPRYGLSGYAALTQQQYTLQQATNYNANILRNGGVPFAFACPKDASSTFSPQEFVDKAKGKVSGDKVGEWLAWNEPITLTFPNVTPESMSLDTMQDRPESDIAAVLGTPAQVAGLHVGRLSKTYANVKEARESFWEETIIPLLLLVYSQIGAALLPRFGYDTDNYRLYPDITDIRPLQPDKDALHKRIWGDYDRGIISLAVALTELGYATETGDENIYAHGERGKGGGLSPNAEPDSARRSGVQGGGSAPTLSGRQGGGEESLTGTQSKSLPHFLRDYTVEASARKDAYMELFGEMPDEDFGTDGAIRPAQRDDQEADRARTNGHSKTPVTSPHG